MASSSVLSLARLRDHIEQGGLAALHRVNGAPDSRSQVAWTLDRSSAVHAVSLRHRRVINIGVGKTRTDVHPIDSALRAGSHVLDVHERDHGVFVFPDSNAQFLGEKPQHVYSVRFTARELWGDQAKPQDSVYLAMWDDYLEPA